jgi:hypothetical protein
MAYTVNKTNSSASPNQYTVQDGVVNTQMDLSFIGKGYAGYGELIAENFLHLLENFANSTAPTKPIQGQLWYDSSESRLKVFTGTTFLPSGGNVPYQSTAPSTLTQGDLWIDSDTGQLFFYNGTSSVLVGPTASTGANNGFIFETILDSTDTSQNITKWYNDGNLIAIVSEDAFTPKTSITGFATIKKGITLSTAISDLKFQGTADDADKLGGVDAANYLRSNANDTTSGTISVANDGGLIVGVDSDLTLTVDSTGALITNTTPDTDIKFRVNDGGSTTTVMTINGASSRVGIGTTSPSTKLQVVGTVTATAFTGPLTGAVTGTLSSSGANTMGTLTMGGTLTSKAILPDISATYDIGSSGKTYNKIYAKATSAQYADLAEKYTTDREYEIGTVVMVNTTDASEVTSVVAGFPPVGVISGSPAYLMNADSEGQAVALKGRVPVKIVGPVSKGQVVYVDHDGLASASITGSITVTTNTGVTTVGVALESNSDSGVKLVECILKV